MSADRCPCVLLAGGGSGGHIFPNIAVAERLAEAGVDAVFAVSNRPLDAAICQQQGLDFRATRAAPLSMKPKGLLAFAQGFRAAKGQVCEWIAGGGCDAVVATGGFVSAPVAAAAKRRVPVALVSLDAVPGKANRLAARWADRLFTTYDTDRLADAQRVGMPLRRASVLPREMADSEAKKELSLPADRDVLLVTAGSQGLASTNRMMMQLLEKGADPFLRRFKVEPSVSSGGWHVLHLAGKRDAAEVESAYAEAGVSATVLPFCQKMGYAWRAASLAISLAGAGSVAEAWANAVPTVFFPYPYHRDQHQKLNAQPIVATGGALLLEDTIDPTENVARLSGPLSELLLEVDRREQMAMILRQTVPPDGAQTLADWVLEQIKP